MKEIGNRNFDLLVHPDKCAGCLTCELRCSWRLYKESRPTAAAIIIDRTQSRILGSKITFTERCDLCGICGRYCPYGALVWQKREKEAAANPLASHPGATFIPTGLTPLVR